MRTWNWVAIAGAVLYVGSIAVRELGNSNTEVQGFARNTYHIGGIVLLVYWAGYFIARFFRRRSPLTPSN